MTAFEWGAVSDTGRVRSGNEDFVLAAGTLFAVADGMGGHSGGEIASHLAVESVMQIYDDGGRHTTDALVEAVRLANDALVQRAEREPDLKGMGTTICALALVEGADQPLIGVINVGDSRLYLLKREGDLEQITEDHSLVATLERQGRISKAEAAVHPQRNIITRALGIDPTVMVDSWEIVPFVGDRYLICSDGLYNEVDDAKVASVLRRLADPAEAAHELVRLANEGGGRDNISVVVVDVVDDDRRPHPDDERIAAVTHGSDRVLRTSVTAPRKDGSKANGGSPAPGREDREPGDPGPGDPGPGDPVAADRDGVAVAAGEGSSEHGEDPGADEDREAPSGGGRRLLTWRVVVFFAVVAALVGVAYLAITYVGTRTYFVGVAGDEVVIYRGRPGGVLWIEPSLEEPTGVPVVEVPPALVPEIEAGKQQATLDDAHAYVSNLKRQIDELEAATTTTTEAPTTTSAAPADPGQPAPADAAAVAPTVP